jgi:hypothetical protein
VRRAVAQTSRSTTGLARETSSGKKKRDAEERAEAGGHPNPGARQHSF